MLTEAQQATIREEATDILYRDVMQNWDRLKDVIGDYVATMGVLAAAETAECDVSYWPQVFSFDPETGNPWPVED